MGLVGRGRGYAFKGHFAAVGSREGGRNESESEANTKTKTKPIRINNMDSHKNEYVAPTARRGSSTEGEGQGRG